MDNTTTALVARKYVAGKRFTSVYSYSKTYFEGWYKKHWFVVRRLTSDERRAQCLPLVRGEFVFDVSVVDENGGTCCETYETCRTIEQAITCGMKGSLL